PTAGLVGPTPNALVRTPRTLQPPARRRIHRPGVGSTDRRPWHMGKNRLLPDLRRKRRPVRPRPATSAPVIQPRRFPGGQINLGSDGRIPLRPRAKISPP